MAILKTQEDLKLHMRSALRRKDRWLVIATAGPASRSFGLLAVVLLRLGVPEEQMHLTAFEFHNKPTGHRGFLTLLSIPRAAMSADRLGALLTLSGCESQASVVAEDCEFLLMVDDKASEELVSCFVLEMKQQAAQFDPTIN